MRTGPRSQKNTWHPLYAASSKCSASVCRSYKNPACITKSAKIRGTLCVPLPANVQPRYAAPMKIVPLARFHAPSEPRVWRKRDCGPVLNETSEGMVLPEVRFEGRLLEDKGSEFGADTPEFLLRGLG